MMEQTRGGPVIALMGNPNVGKSTLFNSLTGLRQHTGNWPGKTVATAEGVFSFRGNVYTLVDLPGTYSLSARSPEEEIARDFLYSGKADAAVVVCDATALERSLPLVFQVMEITDYILVCVNLMDEAEKRGIQVDIPLLGKYLGIPVVGVTARKKRSLTPLLEMTEQAAIRPGVKSPFLLPHTAEERFALARDITLETVRYSVTDRDRRDHQADRLLTSRLVGYPLMLLLLAFLFWVTIRGANAPSALLSSQLFGLGERLSDFLLSLSCPVWLHDALILGVYRMLAWVVSVMLPPMAIFFPLFTLLEDAGYLPRVAFNLDKPFHRCSACGKQALTMAMGFGCNAAGVVGCRIIDSPRERLLAVVTNSLVPCNGRFPILILLLGLFFAAHTFVTALMLTALVLLGITVTFLMTKLLSMTFLKGEASSFVLELPPYRRPQIGQVLVRSVLDRTVFVLARAAAIAAPAGLLLWILANIQTNTASLLLVLARSLDPLGHLMGMDGVILLAFILGFPANETVIPIALMIYLSQRSLSTSVSPSEIGEILRSNGWTWTTAGSVLIFTLMHWPCSTTLLTIWKETRSGKWTLLSFLLPTICGTVFCILFHGITGLLGV